ncbi:tripartite-type tricarboxylate transporter receptor subunit TctC [Ancylobacter aquaticus]|uniref:Tripartite-type tricarboxylate transporter receptor subunit TctC n=2 Tax=Ancylobacter aquaticus TaxID=100 RepID=A0A4R1I1Z6_ANCAQ|nr:tripartite-type tricarboxylate transporter receptor subunit TctC [Ancylobacter aquaticus]
MISRPSWARALAGTVIAFSLVAPVHAQDWPTRPIEDSVWSSAGGATDLVNRLMAKALEPHLGVKVNVVNRTGGGGAVAMNYVWSQPHNGNYWLGASEGMQTTAVMGFHTTKTKDWRWYMVAGAPGSLAVPVNSPFKTVDDFLAAAKASPGKVNVSHSALGSVWHLKGVALANATGTQLNLIPYEGSAPAMVAAMSGETAAVISSVSEQAEYIKGGRLRSLGLVEMTDQEFPGLGKLSGIGKAYPKLKDIPARQWVGFAVPGDVPADVVTKIDAAFDLAVKDPELKKIADDKLLTIFGTRGDASMKELQEMESALSWTLWDLKVGKVDPATLDIARP